jgi:hypothetical protein
LIVTSLPPPRVTVMLPDMFCRSISPCGPSLTVRLIASV